MIRRLFFVSLLTPFLIIIAAVVLPGVGTEASEIRQAAVFQKPDFVVSEKSEGSKQMDAKPKKVKLETTMGDIVIELDEKAAPVTVKNFLTYVEESFFDGTIFHRVIPNFMIQGGGFTPDMAQKKTHPPIVNEAKNGLKNNRGTIAMARTSQPDSATSQFFINHKDNPNLNYVDERNPGYAVFGKVVEGMETVDKIAAVKTTQKGPHSDVPAEPVVIKSAKVVSGK
jgi:cyclophilin family peptidyl-prolyl cis-trans isomerase